jgi:hypothetical protein
VRTLPAALAAAALFAGCGGSTAPEAPRQAGAAATATAAPARVDLAFTETGPQPRRVVVRSAPVLTLRVASRDGRPRSVRITVPGRPRVLVPPGGEEVVRLRDVPRGRYAFVPAGAEDPIPLVVR